MECPGKALFWNAPPKRLISLTKIWSSSVKPSSNDEMKKKMSKYATITTETELEFCVTTKSIWKNLMLSKRIELLTSSLQDWRSTTKLWELEVYLISLKNIFQIINWNYTIFRKILEKFLANAKRIKLNW